MEEGVGGGGDSGGVALHKYFWVNLRDYPFANVCKRVVCLYRFFYPIMFIA